MTEEQLKYTFHEATKNWQISTKEIDVLINSRKDAFLKGMKFALDNPQVARVMLEPSVGMSEDIAKIVDGKE